MPIHRIPRVTLHEDLLELMRHDGEKVVSVTVDGPLHFRVVTEFVGVETRPVTVGVE